MGCLWNSYRVLLSKSLENATVYPRFMEQVGFQFVSKFDSVLFLVMLVSKLFRKSNVNYGNFDNGNFLLSRRKFSPSHDTDSIVP